MTDAPGSRKLRCLFFITPTADVVTAQLARFQGPPVSHLAHGTRAISTKRRLSLFLKNSSRKRTLNFEFTCPRRTARDVRPLSTLLSSARYRRRHDASTTIIILARYRISPLALCLISSFFLGSYPSLFMVNRKRRDDAYHRHLAASGDTRLFNFFRHRAGTAVSLFGYNKR